MAYKSKFGSNPFEDEEKDDDSFQDLSNDPELMGIRQQQDYYRQQMVQSSNRSVQMIIESQSAAIETAEELRKQREQLERTSKNLDTIHGDLNQSDRNITSMKSIWGTMSNWFKKPLPKTDPVETTGAKSLENDDDKKLEEENRQLQADLRRMDRTVDSAYQSGSSASQSRQQTTTEDDLVNKNLDTLLAGLTALKGQGLTLGNEIDEQNVMIDDIGRRTEGVDLRIDDQNSRMKKILRR